MASKAELYEENETLRSELATIRDRIDELLSDEDEMVEEEG